MKIHKEISPNFDRRPEGAGPRILVFHYTGMRSIDDALDRLLDPEARVSAHYLIAEGGKIIQLVDESDRAWHAGVSHWRGVDGINDVSIGVELQNPGHEFGYRRFSEPQMRSLEVLSREIVDRYEIDPIDIVGHSDIAPDRKTDPGELFDWSRLARAGIGIWLGDVHNLPEEGQGSENPDLDWRLLQRRLRKIGYGLPVSERPDRRTRDVLVAFQRHWRPQAVTGEADPHCLKVLAALLERVC